MKAEVTLRLIKSASFFPFNFWNFNGEKCFFSH